MIEPLDDPEFRALLLRMGINIKLIEKCWIKHHEMILIKGNLLKESD